MKEILYFKKQEHLVSESHTCSKDDVKTFAWRRLNAQLKKQINSILEVKLKKDFYDVQFNFVINKSTVEIPHLIDGDTEIITIICTYDYQIIENKKEDTLRDIIDNLICNCLEKTAENAIISYLFDLGFENIHELLEEGTNVNNNCYNFAHKISSDGILYGITVVSNDE